MMEEDIPTPDVELDPAPEADPVLDSLTDPDLLVSSKPTFAPLSAMEMSGGETEIRAVSVPANRMTPLKTHWKDIVTPIVEYMKLQIRMNVPKHRIELKTSEFTTDPGAIRKACDFLEAFCMGFEVMDAIALLRMDDLYLDIHIIFAVHELIRSLIETFDIRDARDLKGDHLSRAIGRIAGQSGKTKFAIENGLKIRIVLADTKIHILGTYERIQAARGIISELIRGSPPGKIHEQIRRISARISERL